MPLTRQARGAFQARGAAKVPSAWAPGPRGAWAPGDRAERGLVWSRSDHKAEHSLPEREASTKGREGTAPVHAQRTRAANNASEEVTLVDDVLEPRRFLRYHTGRQEQ